jgi:hypothetical protein
MGRRGKPLEIDVQRMERRLLQPGVADSMAMIGSPDVWRLLSTYVAGPDALELIVGRDVPENSDDRPYLEYAVLRSAPLTERTFAANLEMFEPHWEPVEGLLGSPDRTRDNVLRLAREQRIMKRLLRSRIHRMLGERTLWEKGLRSLIRDAGMAEQEFRSLWPFYR